MNNKSGEKKTYFTAAGIVLTVAGFVIMLMFSPLLSFVCNSGTIVGTSVGLAILLSGIFFKYLKRFFAFVWKRTVLRIVLLIILALITVFISLMCTVVAKMVIASQYDGTECSTVIVLGCGLKPDGAPSTSLTLRLKAAYGFLTVNQDCICILSGGKGDDEPISEAQAMYDWLTEKGIDGSRLIKEEKSENTKQNIIYSNEIIIENGLSDSVIIITSDFHMYRAVRFAKENNLIPHSYPAKSAFFSAPTYWLREICGICYYTVFGWQ